MNALERLNLIDRIGRELQSRMSYTDIDQYLRAVGVDVTKPTSGVNSKWVYTKELLADVSDAVVLQIATELDLDHAFPSSTSTPSATFWAPHHFRLFLSHLSAFKKTTGALQRALGRFGISAFVAHVDIEPTKPWQDEIEAGLLSMDALAAILMPGFKESHWTDQEVGVAVGRGILVIPIIRGLNPYGFIAKYQGLQGTGKSVSQVAHEVFLILVSSPRTRERMLTCLVDTILHSSDSGGASEKLDYLAAIDDVPTATLQRLRDGALSSGVFSDGALRKKLEDFVVLRGLDKLSAPERDPFSSEGEVPF